MNKLLALACALIVMVSASSVSSVPFTPGNLVLVDAKDDMLIEVTLGETEATVVQVVRWELGDTSRRRPLGIAFDPSGICYVGLTGVPTSATETVDFPSGRGEILRIFPDQTQDFLILPPEITKGTWISSFAANEVFVMSNEPPPPLPSQSYNYRFEGSTNVDTTTFDVTETAQDNGNGGNGKALVIPDGRILIPSNMDQFINVYTADGGAPIDSIATEGTYRSLAYLEGSNELLAIADETTVDRIDMDGTILGTFDFSLDGMGGVWNFSLIPDGSEHFIVTNHNGPTDTKSMIFIYDSTNLDDAPLPQELLIVGLDNFEDADGLATQLFDHAFVPIATAINDWSIY